jgi:hypothetical protein
MGIGGRCQQQQGCENLHFGTVMFGGWGCAVRLSSRVRKPGNRQSGRQMLYNLGSLHN